MKQVGLHCFYAIFSESFSALCTTLNSEHYVVSQEILDEVVRELHRVKDEIINGEQWLVGRCSFSTFQGHKARSNTSNVKPDLSAIILIFNFFNPNLIFTFFNLSSYVSSLCSLLRC